MLKKDFRSLDKKPGMEFRLICSGKIGTAESFFKDSVMLIVKDKAAAEGKHKLFCPCEMLELPVGEWKRETKKPPEKKIKKVCPTCGKPFTSAPSKDKTYCSRACWLNRRQRGREHSGKEKEAAQ